MHAAWVFLSNLKIAIQIPMFFGLLACIAVVVEGLISRSSGIGTRRAEAENRIRIAIQVFFFGGIVWTILHAIPAPDYNVEKVIVHAPAPPPVVKVVHDTYKDLWDHCNDNYSLDGTPDNIVAGIRNDRMKICNEMAREGSREFENDNEAIKAHSGVDKDTASK